MPPEWIGYLAAFLTTAAYVPQAYKVLVERHTKSLSLGMYSMMTCGIACWLVYGLMIGDIPIIVANGVTLVLAFAILVMKIRCG